MLISYELTTFFVLKSSSIINKLDYCLSTGCKGFIPRLNEILNFI